MKRWKTSDENKNKLSFIAPCNWIHIFLFFFFEWSELKNRKDAKKCGEHKQHSHNLIELVIHNGMHWNKNTWKMHFRVRIVEMFAHFPYVVCAFQLECAVIFMLVVEQEKKPKNLSYFCDAIERAFGFFRVKSDLEIQFIGLRYTWMLMIISFFANGIFIQFNAVFLHKNKQNTSVWKIA